MNCLHADDPIFHTTSCCQFDQHMSLSSRGPGGDSHEKVHFFDNRLAELGATKQHKLAQSEALRQEIAGLDSEMREVSDSLGRFKMYNEVFARRDTWSHMNKFIPPENGALSRMLLVSKGWHASCNQCHDTVEDLQPLIDGLYEKNNWPAMNELFALSSRPAMRMKMLYKTLKKEPVDPNDGPRANLKRFVEEAGGMELLVHVGTKCLANENVVTHICKILMCFDEFADQGACGDSDPDESNGESETIVFISNPNMLAIANMIVDMYHCHAATGRFLALLAKTTHHAKIDKVLALLKKTMIHLKFHDVVLEHTHIQDILGGIYPGSSFPFRPFTQQEIAARQRVWTKHPHATHP